MFGKDKKEEYNEKVLYETQPNIFVYSKGILISMFVLGFLFFLYSAGVSFIGNMNVYLIETTKVPITRYFAIAIFILILIVFAYIIIKLLIWTSIKYTITESRVIVEKGILLQKKNYMPFNTIQDISRSQSLLGKIFSVGTITLYSAYDGKELELKDVSSPKKIEDLIFENMRGTHLRYRNVNDDFSINPAFNPRHNSSEPAHYRRMEDLDDLELIDAKERKRQLRDIKRKSKNSRNNYNNFNNSNYDDAYRDDRYYDDAYRDDRYYDDDYYDDYSYDGRRDHREGYNSNPRNYGSYPNRHHHQYSGAIKESYERNPKKYFANNYEEFHQNNLDAQMDYQEQRNYGSPHQAQERVNYNNQDDYYGSAKENNKKSKGLSRFNPFSSNKKEDGYEKNISDEEFDTTINQAMDNMDKNIKFESSNRQINHNSNYHNNQHYSSRNQYNPNRDSYNQQNKHARRYDSEHNQNYNSNYHSNHNGEYYDDYDYRGHKSAYRPNDYGSRVKDDYNSYGHESRDRDTYKSQNYDKRSGRAYNPKRQQNNRHDNYSDNYSPRYQGKERDSNYRSANYEDNSNYEKSNSKNEKANKEKTSDDLFEKHSRKFRR